MVVTDENGAFNDCSAAFTLRRWQMRKRDAHLDHDDEVCEDGRSRSCDGARAVISRVTLS
jgi:hypothetical protein